MAVEHLDDVDFVDKSLASIFMPLDPFHALFEPLGARHEAAAVGVEQSREEELTVVVVVLFRTFGVFRSCVLPKGTISWQPRNSNATQYRCSKLQKDS